MFSVSYFAALSAGIASFFSPCLLPLIPMYITYMSGGQELERSRGTTVRRTAAFVLGFTLIFVMMGFSASYLGKLFSTYNQMFTKISGTIIFLVGLNMLGVVKLRKNKGDQNAFAIVNNPLGPFIMGVAFATSWTPCFGPILAAILVIAGQSATVMQGGLLLSIYSVGLAVPFFITSLFIYRLKGLDLKSARWSTLLQKIGGIIMLVYGLLIFSGHIQVLNRLF